MVRVTEFDASACLDDDEVVAKYLTAALEDPDPDVFLASTRWFILRSAPVFIVIARPSDYRQPRTVMNDLPRHMGKRATAEPGN